MRNESRTAAGLILFCVFVLVAWLLSLFDEVQGGPTWTSEIVLVVGVVTLGAYAFLVFWPQRALGNRLAEIEAQRMATENRLVASLDEVSSGDLIAAASESMDLPQALAAAFSETTGSLEGQAQQIQSSSVEVARAANSVKELASELASGSSEQAASVVEITAAMEELARTAAQIAENAGIQAQLASKAQASGDAGSTAVEQAVEGVERVQKRITGIASRADTLGNRSKEIYRVLDLITEIAQETHILSLNAAIEASAAGEHGRRFSVVAEEVRRLAQRSQESVDSVRNLLDEFASSIRATVIATEEGTKEAAQVLERTRAAAAAIEELRRASGETAQVAREISLATQQQNAASDQVVLTLKEVSQVVQRMADNLKEFSSTADRLDRLGLAIQLVAQSFHIDSPHSLKQLAAEWAADLAPRISNWESVESYLAERLEDNGFIELAYASDKARINKVFVRNDSLTGSREIPAMVYNSEGLEDRPWFRGVMRQERAILTNVYESLVTGGECFTIAAPILNSQGEFVAILGLDINVKSWTRI